MKKILVFILIFSLFPLFGTCSDSLFQKGLEELVQGNYSEAENYFQKDVSKNPNYANYYNLGIAAGNLSNWTKAKWAFESALKYKPFNKDVQYNAKFATQQLSESQSWDDPYGVGKKVIVGFGSAIWVILTIVFSLLTGVSIYILLRKHKNNTLLKWSRRLIVPALLLFLISSFCVYSINFHFNHQAFAILKNDETQFYISPNGVQVDNNANPSNRFQVLKYSKDSSWVQLRSQKNKVLWVKQKNVYSY